MKLWWAFLVVTACQPAPHAPPPIPDAAGKPVTGPPSLTLGAPEAPFMALPDNGPLALVESDGGWLVPLSVQARNVTGPTATLTYRFLDADTLAPSEETAPLTIALDLTDAGVCEAPGLGLPLTQPQRVQDRSSWLDVQLLDPAGRQASVRQRIHVTGGPDAGLPLDGGPSDAADDGGL